jgi:hypothetical protein
VSTSGATFRVPMSKTKKEEQSRFVNLKDARAILSRLLTDAQTKPVMIVRHGKPSVILLGVEGKTFEQAMAEMAKYE